MMDSILIKRRIRNDFYGVLFLLLQIVSCFNRLLPLAYGGKGLRVVPGLNLCGGVFKPRGLVQKVGSQGYSKDKNFYTISLDKNFYTLCSKSEGVCVSPGGRFPAYTIQGKPPRKVSKGPTDLTLCRVYRKNTCCDVTQTHPALLAIRRLASTGEASDECLHLWELLECSICDPHVGVQTGSPVVCASLCDRIYDACSNAYFAMDTKTQVLAPCGISDTVCGRASEWVSNGTELCKATGFSVKASNDFKDSFCYGGKASLESVVDSWRGSHSSVPRDLKSSGFLFDFQQWVKEMSINEQVSWAVGGLVLTAGLLFISKRKSHNQRRLSAVQRTARKLGGKTSPKYPASQANRE